MNIKTAAAWSLLIFTVGAAFYLFLLPALQPKRPEVIAKGDLVDAGKNEDGEPQYYLIQAQIEWAIDQLQKLLPSISAFLSAWYFRGRREQKKNGR